MSSMEAAFFPATGAQVTAGAQFTTTMAVDEGILLNQCMSRYGYYVPQPSRHVYLVMNGEDGRFPDLAKIAATHQLNPANFVNQTPANPTTTNGAPITPADAAAFRAAWGKCEQSNSYPKSFFSPLMLAAGSLQSKWDRVITQIQSSAPVRRKLAGFSSCVQAAGVPKVNSASFDLLEAYTDGQETSPTSENPAVDAHFAAIFVRCARPTVALQEKLQLAKRVQFLQAHAKQIRSLGLIADQLISQASIAIRASTDH